MQPATIDTGSIEQIIQEATTLLINEQLQSHVGQRHSRQQAEEMQRKTTKTLRYLFWGFVYEPRIPAPRINEHTPQFVTIGMA